MTRLSVFILVLTSQINSYANDPAPRFTSKPPTRVAVNDAYNYVFSAEDSLGRALEFSVNGLPSWLSYSSVDHKISGKCDRPGQYLVRIQATNGKTETVQVFMLTVFNDQTKTILPIGNSITNGTDKYNSYRRLLWKKLHDAKLNFDFIGSWDKHHMGGEVPDPDFDMDHEGHSGWTAEHMFIPPDWDTIRGNIKKWLLTYSPDIVLVELGTNDVFQCRQANDVIKNFSELVTILRNKNKNVGIFISLVPPLGPEWSVQNLCNSSPYGELITALNAKIRTFVNDQNTKQSPVILVDQFSGVDPGQHMYDGIHPNDAGEEIMATRWFDAIKSSLKKIKN